MIGVIEVAEGRQADAWVQEISGQAGPGGPRAARRGDEEEDLDDEDEDLEEEDLDDEDLDDEDLDNDDLLDDEDENDGEFVDDDDDTDEEDEDPVRTASGGRRRRHA